MTNDSQQLQFHFKQFFSSNSLRINLFRHIVSFSQIGVLQFYHIYQGNLSEIPVGPDASCCLWDYVSVQRPKTQKGFREWETEKSWSMKQLGVFVNPKIGGIFEKKTFK